ncbi:MAG: RnfABCDGE type electron transport complex subunit D [Lachnospiraceae bacterium]|jgi:electron transport complex protein RnfD/electron transport complex protein RnfC|nr:RnfABCDGE type electron transport complex subunit D [Lachnospiraceae bacterium]MBP5276314.1 RnfABCDGE type electron transport complex subunit D [Lachnospiraceae bacterium]MBQ4275828.1 RnfABCDGE type electron transport complex subunit D [Lachnospiraceae bacterium]MCR4696789.1 RnfABCDGE type electron transport complex subunit D [Lachnospiraceae bacterium]
MSENTEKKEAKKLLKVSSNPHVRDGMNTRSIMLAVVIALMPATIFGIINFGYHAFLVVATAVGFSVLAEFVMCKILKKPVSISDCSAIVTGLLLGLNLPPMFPLWMTAVGACFAIVVVKMLFGGLGQNFMNPALGARCFLVISFAKYMTNFNCDAYTGATPLAVLKSGGAVNIYDMVIGRTAGTIGETSMIAIVLGACFLIALGIIDLRIPGMYILSFVIFILIFGKRGFDFNFVCAHLAGGGLMLGAFFMATDYVTRPITKKGQYVYGILLGILTGIFRIFGASAEGVSYAIILGNLLVPLIEKITLPKAFGKGGENS